MPSKSSGRIEKVRKNNSTPHQKNHRWESFSTKISKFNSLQPLRKVRRHDLDTEDLSTTTSYFQSGLQKWNELNISTGFVSFKRQVLPLCESLPQLLHFEQRIMESLAEHIAMQEKEALEPLLDLLTAFSHDLGVRFEKHYGRSLQLILDIAGRPQPVEVIEWTFGALAFLFKYLSKLLVPDLRPTYDVMAPLLGKSRHPPYIARFAAESMSFLVKKAAAPSHRETALVHFVEHAMKDLRSMTEDTQFLLYKDGLMTMFAEAIKGTEYAIHSTGPYIFAALMDAIPEEERTLSLETPCTDLVCGVLTSTIHHATQDTYGDLAESVLVKINSAHESVDVGKAQWQLIPHIRILGVLAGVRRGNRMSNWPRILKELVSVLGKMARTAEEVPTEKDTVVWDMVILNIAIIVHHAPIDALIPQISSLVQSFRTEPLIRWFIPFCSYFCELDSRRFESLFRTDFQRFVAAHWSQGQNEDVLCVLLPTMIENRVFAPIGEKDSFKLPQGWQDQIVSKFERLEISPFPERGSYNKDPQVWRDRCLPKYSALLRLLELTTVHPSTNARIAELLLRKLKLALRPLSSLASDEVHFIVSQGFHAYLRMSKAAGEVDGTLSPLLRAAVPRFSRSVGFLHAYLSYERFLQETEQGRQDSSSSDGSVPEEDPLIRSLIANLSSPSHDIRLASLELLRQINDTPDPNQLIETMVEVEQTPLSLDHTRAVGMLLRRLAQQYASLDETTWLQKGVPAFMFGMLTVKMSPIWDDAVEALKQISQCKAGEEAVCVVAFQWLEVASARWMPSQPESYGSRANFVSDFECTTIIHLQRSADTTRTAISNPDELMLQAFDLKQHTAEPFLSNARSRALKVLTAAPFLVEKRSRQLVPHFLSWASDDSDEASLLAEEEVESQGASWSLVDRKALLGVFSQFVNPRVLFQHERVYDALLQLLENGDAEFQKLCLKAILAWKQEGVKPYQENLEYLLDESRFKNELTVFLQGDNVIKPEHRPELMPVLLRLLYGRTISKKGAASGRNGLQATRLAVLRNLSVEDMGSFLNIMTGKLKDVRVVGSAAHRKKLFERPIITARKQVGFLNMISSLISELGTNVGPYMNTLLNAVLYCTVFACRHLEDNDTQGEPSTEETGKGSTTSLLKTARSTGIKCVITLFQNAQSFQWAPYQDIIVEEIVVPRLDKLSKETTQGVSGMLQLLSTWSILPRIALFLAPHGDILPQGVLPNVIACISVEKAKDEVKIFTLEIIRNLVKLAVAPASESEFNEVIKAELLDPNVKSILANVTAVLESSTTSTDLLEACVETILSLASVVHDADSVQAVIRISTFLLQQPPRRVNPKAKGRVLLIIEGFLTLPSAGQDQAMLDDLYETLSSLFSYFKDRENRQSLSRALAAVSGDDEDLASTATLCADLNSFKKGRIEEPDYDRRLSAFTAISRSREVPLTLKQWLPLLHNLIFFIRDDEEFGILSSNSADGVRRFVQDVANYESQPLKSTFEVQMETILMPAIYAGARELSETVRREHLRVLGFILSVMPDWKPVADLKGLLNERQEDTAEPTFFFNILSPATSRQLEALRMLESANLSSEIGSQNLGQFFIPLLEHFIFGRTDGTDDHGLGAQATNTIGNLAMSLHWKHYRTTMQRYISYIGSREELQKQTVRLMGRFADALVPAVQIDVDENMDVDQAEATPTATQRLALTAPRGQQLNADISSFFLPPLMKYLHEKDESEVSYRVPVGVIIVKLLKLMPPEQMDQKLAAVLTDICHILRSKSLEARDMVRDTLVKITVVLGPSYFGFILKELRSALTKGYQLHVLSYTMHSMLVAAVPGFAPGDLDYCLPFIVTIIMDDIFGVIGQEKDAEGYTSTMKEIKSSKSQDSMELIAKNASINHLIDLVKPLRALLMQKIDLKIVRKIDALMARITSGLLQNTSAESQETLVFCYEVVQEFYKSQQPEAVEKMDFKIRKYLVQRGAKKSGDRGKGMKHTYKLVRFAFDILRAIVKKHDGLRTPANLTGFLPIFGDAILEGEDEVKISAFRLLAVIVKVPFSDEDGSNLYKVAVKEATKSISMATSTTTDLSQAALKMLAVVLRDRRDVPVKDAAMDMLLGKLKDDLTEPLFRHVTFNFLRSVLDRRVETAAVYDTMDYVGTVMITNDDKDTRDLARGAFFQFIREYPQKKARWSKQLNFIVSNLKYDREGGRLSVMEIVHLLLMKSSDDFVQEVAATCFLPLFLVLANDDSEKCRRSATELMKEIFRKSDKERTQGFLTLLRSWLDNDANLAVQKLALMVAGYYFESHEAASKNKKDLKLVLEKASSVLAADDVYSVDGELVETTIEVIRVLTTVFPERLLSTECPQLWENVARFMRHPETPAQLAAVRLISLYLSDFAKQGANKTAGEAVAGSYGRHLGIEEVQELVRLSLVVLAKNQVDESVAREVSQVLIFLGPRLPVEAEADAADDEDIDEDVEVDDDDEGTAKKQKSLQYLFWRLSHILRREIAPRAVAIHSKSAAMEVLETICRRSATERLQPSLKTILEPLHNLTDPSIPAPFSNDELFKTKHEALKTRAQILMDSLQKKFGTAEYSKQLLAIRDEVRARRQQRSSKRKIEAIAHPEKYGRDKRKRFEKERERRKVRSKEQQVARQSYKGW